MKSTNFRPQKQLPRERPASKPTRQSNGRKKLLERDSTVLPTRWPRWHWRDRALSRSPIFSCDGLGNAAPPSSTVFCNTLLGRTWKAHGGARVSGALTEQYKQRNDKVIKHDKPQTQRSQGNKYIKMIHIFTSDIT